TLVAIIDGEATDEPRQDVVSNEPGNLGVRPRIAMGSVRRITSPDLVSSVSSHHHLDVARGEPREQKRRQERRIGQWFVEFVERLVNDVENVPLVQVLRYELDVQPFRHEPRVATLVEGRVLESDREGFHPPAG